MAEQRRSTDREWQSWWFAAWQSTPRWPSALGADREAQSFDWPTAAQQSWSQSLSAAADATVPMNTGAPSQDPHSSVQDAFSQTSWTTLPRRRIRSKRSRTLGPRLDTADKAGTPLGSHAGLLSRSSPSWAVYRAPRFSGTPGLPLPPSLTVPPGLQVLCDFVPPASSHAITQATDA